MIYGGEFSIGNAHWMYFALEGVKFGLIRNVLPKIIFLVCLQV